ncbi:C-C motif chemokine 4-like [Engraulis encrasicolus]|uniref:C-C motif chemokine 4-like n=1 Tax=Engraulis encrasicolus TaxID=184585 RepID=UPI002FD015A5
MARVLLMTSLAMLLCAVMVTEGLRMASGPKMCCFKFENRPLPAKRVIGYSLTSPLCSNPAVVLETARRQVCAQPSEGWVQQIMKSVDSKKPGQQTPL